MIHTLKLFLSTIFVCFIFDILWLGLVAKNLYDDEIGGLLKKTNGVLSPNWPAAIFVYIAIATGIVCFVIPKANNMSNAVLHGALYGLIVYGVYDFTNLSILKEWSFKIAIIDFCWGIALCSVTTLITFLCKNWLFRF